MTNRRPRVLYTSAEVRAAIAFLFRKAEVTRVAISAYVGDGAEAYLPYPKGLRLICSPTPGATNPHALRRLMKRGAIVEFVNSLHMKIYWAEARGAVITSANLSTNAMGIGGLKEAGILLRAGEIDIQKLIRSLKPRIAEPELHTLDRKHKDVVRRVPWAIGKRTTYDFAAWYESPAREMWKIFLYETTSQDLSDFANQSVKHEFGQKPHAWIWSEAAIQETDWVLCVDTSKKRRLSVEWLFADRIIHVPRTDRNYDPDFPYEVIQVGPSRWYPPPPFRLGRRFQTAITKVLRGKSIAESYIPKPATGRLLTEIYRNSR